MKFYEYIIIFILAFGAGFLIKTYFIGNISVPSGSMLPTIQLEERFFVNMMVKSEDFKHNDILVFQPPIEEKQKYIKRLVGMPGDIIEVKDGFLFRNGKKIEEKYLKEKATYEFGPIEVPKGKYLFLGDNRNNSYDSHLWEKTFVEEDEIVGKAIYRYYPFNKMGPIE